MVKTERTGDERGRHENEEETQDNQNHYVAFLAYTFRNYNTNLGCFMHHS